MKRMIGVAAALLLAGCSTIPQTRLEHIQHGSELAAYTSVALLLAEKPAAEPTVLLVRDGLQALSDTESFSPEALAILLSKLPIDQLEDGRTRILITSLLLLYQDTVGTMQVDQPEVMRAVTDGLLRGIGLALAQETIRKVP